MRLTPEQRSQFDRDGYLFFPGLFSPDETRVLTNAVPELYTSSGGSSGLRTSPTPTSPPSAAWQTTARVPLTRWTCPGKMARPPAPCTPRWAY